MLNPQDTQAGLRRALLRRAIGAADDPEALTGPQRAALTEELSQWLDEWMAELDDDQLTPEEHELQGRASWSARVYNAGT